MAARDRVVTQVFSASALSARDWDEIWTLTDEFYDVERTYAEAELRRRQRIAMFRLDGALLGIASIDVYGATFRGRRLTVINTGHVLIRENGRGRNLVQKLGFRTYLKTRLRHPLWPIYWFFDTFSYKSYLLLPRNFRHYWPRYDETTPESRAALIDQLATDLYGPAWRPARGIAVRSGQKRLRPTAAPLDPDRDDDPNLRFFAGTNPGHAAGDMLVCLCPLTLSNWVSVAGRALARRERANAH